LSGNNSSLQRTRSGCVDLFGRRNACLAKIASRSVPAIPTCELSRLRASAFLSRSKLYVAGSRDSSFRAFYFEPKVATNKVRDDAVHLVVGFEHQPREKDGAWKFTRWDLVDLAQFKVRLKAEFQGSNRDMYRPEAIVATGRGMNPLKH
jgi:hypothetical protein